MANTFPMVTCICPTYNHYRFLPLLTPYIIKIIYLSKYKIYKS